MSNPLDNLILPEQAVNQGEVTVRVPTDSGPRALVRSDVLFDTPNKVIPTSEPSPTPGVPTVSPLDGLELPKLTPLQEQYQKLQAEKEKYTLFNSLRPAAIEARGGNILASRSTPDEDIAAYADHYGFDFDTVRKIATLRGAVPPLSQIDSLGELLEAAAGKLNTTTGNLIGFLGKKALTDDPKMRALIDDIGELADGRIGLAETAVGLVLPGVSIGRAAKAVTVARKAEAALASAATGAAYGLAGSKEEGEVEGALGGAVVGAGLAGAASLIPRLFGKGRKLPDADAKTLQAVEDSIAEHKTVTGLDLVKETAAAYEPVRASNVAMRDAIVEQTELTDDAVRLILEQQASPDTKQLVKETLQTRFPDQEITERAIAEEITRLQKSEFVKEMEGRFPQLKYVKTEGKPLRAGEEEVFAYLQRQGPENLKKEYDAWTIGKVAKERLAEAGVKVNPNSDILGKTIINFATDRMFGFKVMDERYGSDILRDFYQVNTNFNYYTGYKQTAAKQIGDIFKIAKANGIHKKAAMENIYQKLNPRQAFGVFGESGYDSLSAGEKKVADEMKAFFERQREFFNTAKGEGYSPLNIPFRENFVAPQMMTTPVEYIIRMKKKLGEVRNALPNIDTMNTEEFMRQVNVRPELAELKNGIELSSQLPITNGKEFATAFNDAIMKGSTEPKLYKLASTTMPRQGAIPDFLLEKNLFKLMTNYVEGTGRSLYLREPLSRMAQKAETLRAAGAEAEAKYVERFIQDNLGIRQYSMARLGNQARIALSEQLDTLLKKHITDPEKREAVLAGFRFLPELAANIQYNIYPNVLALNPRAHMAQLTQVLFKTAPELGGAYGYQSTIKSTASALLNLATPQGRKEFYGKVRALGLEPSGHVREAREGLLEGLEASIMFSVPAKVLRAVADGFMWTYGKMDTFNRAITIDMSERLVRDIKAGDPAAIKAARRMPRSVRNEIVANKGNDFAQLKAIATHLNAATQFNYNRASMSEIGVTLGPLFSTFTKWPLAISGDILADMRTKGIFKSMPRNLEKYAITFLLASAMDSALYSFLNDSELEMSPDFANLSDRARKIVGGGGFRSMTPVQSLKAFLPPEKGAPPEKNLFTPPIVDTLYSGVLAPVFDGDTEALAKGGMKFLSTFGPGSFMERIFLRDIPTIFGDGSKPETLEDSLQFYNF